MANYTGKQFKRYRQILCGVNKGKLPPCEADIKNTIGKWEADSSYYDSGLSDYEKGIINIWGTSDDLCDDDLGLEQLKQAADSGNAKAMNLCAMAYYLVSLQGKHKIGDEGSAQYRSAAADYWQKGAAADQCEALCNLAVCYLEGIGVERDPAKAKQLFKRSAKRGHPEAKQYMKQAGLDKWRTGQEYNGTSLTIQEALNNCRPKPEKKTRRQRIEEDLQKTIIKAQMMTPRKAITSFCKEFPVFRVIQATDYEFITAVTVLDRNISPEEIEKTAVYPRHFKISKLTGETEKLGMKEMMEAVESKEISLDKWMTEGERCFIDLCKERGII